MHPWHLSKRSGRDSLHNFQGISVGLLVSYTVLHNNSLNTPESYLSDVHYEEPKVLLLLKGERQGNRSTGSVPIANTIKTGQHVIQKTICDKLAVVYAKAARLKPEGPLS